MVYSGFVIQLLAGYGSSGWFAGAGFGQNGVSTSAGYSQAGGWNAGISYGRGVGNFSGAGGIGWSQNGGFDWSVGAAYMQFLGSSVTATSFNLPENVTEAIDPTKENLQSIMAEHGLGANSQKKLNIDELTPEGLQNRVSELGKEFSYKDGFLYKGGEEIGGVTLRRGNRSTIFMSPGIFKYGKFSVFINTGHEFVHAFHNSIGLTNSRFSENVAYKWSAAVAKAYGQRKLAASYQAEIRSRYNVVPPITYLTLPKWFPSKY